MGEWESGLVLPTCGVAPLTKLGLDLQVDRQHRNQESCLLGYPTGKVVILSGGKA